jgi:hypothetical protein
MVKAQSLPVFFCGPTAKAAVAIWGGAPWVTFFAVRLPWRTIKIFHRALAKVHDSASLPCKKLPCASIKNARQRLYRAFSGLCRAPNPEFPVVCGWFHCIFATDIYTNPPLLDQ